MEAHVRDCAACRAALAELGANVDTYESRRDEHLAMLRARLAGEPPSPEKRPPWIRLIPAFGAAAVVLAVLLVIALGRREPSAPETVFKGTLSLQVIAKRGDRQFLVRDGVKLMERDALRFVLTTGTRGHLSIFSLNARGDLHPFYPDSDPAVDPAPMQIDRPGRCELPGSVVLDDWVGREHFVTVLSERRFTRERLHERARQLFMEGEIGALTPKALGIRGNVYIISVQKAAR
jgi:hypothetical protein